MANQYQTLLDIQARGDLNPAQATELENLKNSGAVASYGSDGGDGSVDGILNSAIDSLRGLFPKSVQPYDEVNPFFFDEALAKEASTAEYSPYYSELLTDYTTEIERTKSRSREDLDKTLEQLAGGKEYYLGAERRLLDRSLKNVNEGYAGRGLFFSGARKEDVKELQTEFDESTGDYLRRYDIDVGGAKLKESRTGENLETAQGQYTRDNTRAKDLAIEQGVLTRRGEVRDEYEIGRDKYYDSARYGALS